MIRNADLYDIERMVELGDHFINNTKYLGLIVNNREAMEELALNLVQNDNSDVLVDELDNLIVAMLGLVAFKHPISGEPFASEVFWWVEPEFRGRGIRLLRAAENWARSRGARALQMIAPTPDVATIYSRFGYIEIESTYQKTLNEVRTEAHK